MRISTLVLVGMIAAGAAGCGKEIGDKCVIASDCSPNGDRVCDAVSKEGYCTILGCDYNTCPDEATCVRFFTGGFSNRPCDPATENIPGGTDDCSLDELCSLAGLCVPRSAETRFCMRTCDSDGDCRDGYECRDAALMKAHGGEPVLKPRVECASDANCGDGDVCSGGLCRTPEENLPRFCAEAPT